MDDDRFQSDSTQPAEPPTGRVRIVGAETAGQLTGTGEVPRVSEGEGPTEEEAVLGGAGLIHGAEDRGGADVVGAAGHEAAAADEGATESDLPHWTEAPTGEVPAILRRTGARRQEGEDPWATMPGPTWREKDNDWEAHEESFDPSVLAHGDSRLGSLDDSGESDRQPWTFDIPGTGENAAISKQEVGPQSSDTAAWDQETIMVPAVGRQPATAKTEDILFHFDEADQVEVRETETSITGDTRRVGLHEPGGDVSGAVGSSAELPPAVRIVSGEEDEAGVGDLGPVADRNLAGDELETAVEAGTGAPGGEINPSDAPSSTMTAPLRKVGHRPPDRAPGPTGPSPRQSPSPGPRRSPRPGPRRSPRPSPSGDLRRPDPGVEERSDRNIPLAVVSGVVVGVVVLVCFKLGNVASLVVVSAIVTLAAVEAFNAFRKAGYHPATLLGLVATVSLMVATYNRGQQALLLVLVLLVAFTMLWHLAGVDRRADPVLSTGSTLLVFCWVAVFGSFAALLVNPVVFPDRHGIAFLLAAVVVGVAYDVGALATGVWIGRRPMAPSVSPRKTWEGFVGGAVAAILVAVLVVHLIHPWTYGAAAALGIVVAIVSPIGDLAESLVKRHLGLKDMGRILPGHGGVLDRVDGLLFVMPATYYLVRAIHLG